MKKALFASFCALVVTLNLLRSQGWVDVTPPGVQAPSMQSQENTTTCYDPVRQVTWLFVTGQIWSWDGATLAGPIITTAGRSYWLSAWDSVNQRVLLIRRFVQGGSNAYEFLAWDGASEVMLPDPNFASGTSVHYTRMAFDEASGSAIVAHKEGNTVTTRVFDGSAWSIQAPAVTPTLGNSTLVEPSLFYDDTRGRVALAMAYAVQLSSYNPQYWEWTGSNWSQHYPASMPVDLGPVAQASARGFSAAVKFDITQPAPQMFAIADGDVEELFLTSWPAMRAEHHLVYDSGRDRFVLIGGRSAYGGATFRDIWELDLGTTASFTTYGAGCSGSGGVPQLSATSGSTPAVNTQFSIQVSNLPWTGPCFMWLGFSNQTYGGLPLPVNLAVLNAPQCNVLMSPDILYSIPNVLGTSVWTLGIPNAPGFTFYNQVVAFDPAANPLGLVFSNAGEAIVGQ